jgi:PTH1 family peptidyl-tRNA hydrolase
MMNLFRKKHSQDNGRSPYLFAGLGNPGAKYRQNRHNIGFMVVDALAEAVGISLSRVEQHALIGKGRIEEEQIILVKPQTYMNESGRSIAPLIRFYKIPLSQFIVIHDDLDLPLGTIRLRPGGGSGGQRGIESIADKLGTRDFNRLRVGIGRPPGRMDPKDYVLHDFEPKDVEILPEVLARCADAIHRFLHHGIEKAMNDFNGSMLDEV